MASTGDESSGTKEVATLAGGAIHIKLPGRAAIRAESGADSVGNKVRAFAPHNTATTVPPAYLHSAIGNYRLASFYWTDTSDGQLAGVNFAKLPSSVGPSNIAHSVISVPRTRLPLLHKSRKPGS